MRKWLGIVELEQHVALLDTEIASSFHTVHCPACNHLLGAKRHVRNAIVCYCGKHLNVDEVGRVTVRV